MTIQQANQYFAALPDGFADPAQLGALLPASVQQVQFVGVAGTAGKTAVARLLAAILHAQGIRAGVYHAGCEPLAARIRVDGKPVDEALLCRAADALAAHEELPLQAAELVAAAYCFGEAGCTLAVVELPDAGLAAVLPKMPVCAVTAVGPDGVSRSVERLAALAGGVMRKESICVTAPEQPKAVLSELVVAAGKCGCELVVPDPEDITFLEAEQFASRVDYGGYTVPLAFLGRHAAGNAAMAVELALALCRKGVDISDEAILDGIAAVDNRCSIRVLSQRPLVILDACRTPQQAAALLRVLNMAKVRHMSAIIGLTEEEGAEAFFSALETGLSPEEQKKDKSTMPGMSESPFDKVYLVTPAGVEEQLTRRLTEKAKYHVDASSAPVWTRRCSWRTPTPAVGCWSAAARRQLWKLPSCWQRRKLPNGTKNSRRSRTLKLCVRDLFFCKKRRWTSNGNGDFQRSRGDPVCLSGGGNRPRYRPEPADAAGRCTGQPQSPHPNYRPWRGRVHGFLRHRTYSGAAALRPRSGHEPADAARPRTAAKSPAAGGHPLYGEHRKGECAMKAKTVPHPSSVSA